MFKKRATACKESYNELVHKVSWPSSKELANSAILVLVASIIMALVLLGFDLGFENLTKVIYRMIS